MGRMNRRRRHQRKLSQNPNFLPPMPFGVGINVDPIMYSTPDYLLRYVAFTSPDPAERTRAKNALGRLPIRSRGNLS